METTMNSNTKYEHVMTKGHSALIDGKETPYAFCRDNGEYGEVPKDWEFIGTGTIYSINGVKQSGITPYDFYNYKKEISKWDTKLNSN